MGLGNSNYYDVGFHDKYYEDNYDKERIPSKLLSGKKSKIPVEEPVLFVTYDIRDEHQLDESIPEEYKENMDISSLWRMPLLFKPNRFWLVRDDLFKAICDTITVGTYEVYETQIHNSHLNKTFNNYKIIHILNITPNMDESEYIMETKGWKVPMPKFSKLKLNKTDFKEVIPTDYYLLRGPYVTEAFKNKLENFSKEIEFSYLDFENSELGFDVYY